MKREGVWTGINTAITRAWQSTLLAPSGYRGPIRVQRARRTKTCLGTSLRPRRVFSSLFSTICGGELRQSGGPPLLLFFLQNVESHPSKSEGWATRPSSGHYRRAFCYRCRVSVKPLASDLRYPSLEALEVCRGLAGYYVIE